MSERAAELWLEELTDAAEIEGDVVHAALTVDLDIDSVVTIVRRKIASDRPQGVALDSDRPISVGEQSGTRIVLWSDTAPETVDVHVRAGRLTIWNVWRDDGAVQAWTGAAGMRRVELDDADADFGVRLLASDGHDTDGDDLEFDVRISGEHRAD